MRIITVEEHIVDPVIERATHAVLSEAHFKTLKYQPQFPQRFGCIEDANTVCRLFFTWYNHQRSVALNLLRRPVGKQSLRVLRKTAARDDDFFASLITA